MAFGWIIQTPFDGVYNRPHRNKTLESKFTYQEKEQSLGKSENLMHNKEQHEQATYYKDLGEIIRNSKEVLFVGPTNAKVELFNTLKNDHRFAGIKIEVQAANKLTENQQHAFVREYFSGK